MHDKSAKHRVVVVASPGVPIFEFAVTCEVFGHERQGVGDRWYELEIVGTENPTRLHLGITVPGGRGMAALRDADTVVVPACANVHSGAPPVLLEALRAASRRGARIVSLCSGAFVLAEAGLLDGRKATTHWMHAEELGRRYPLAKVDPMVLYVHDGVWTSAGSGAALDLCLELVRQDLGSAAANEIARRIVIPPHRDGGQAQYIRPMRRHQQADGAELEDWTRRHLQHVTVSGLAAHAGISARTLHRRFRERTGKSPQEWIQRERLHAAQELLEDSNLTIETIAAKVGLGTASNLRGRFVRTYSTTPAAYRRTFARGDRSRINKRAFSDGEQTAH